jgi:hypothetical protein
LDWSLIASSDLIDTIVIKLDSVSSFKVTVELTVELTVDVYSTWVLSFESVCIMFDIDNGC